MDNSGMKFVEFDKYCGTCIHKNEKEDSDTCDECLSNPTNVYSRKPVNWKSSE